MQYRIKPHKTLNSCINKLLNNIYSRNDNGIFIKLINNWQEITPDTWQKYTKPVDIKWNLNKANLIVEANNKSLISLLFHQKDSVLVELNKLFDNRHIFNKITLI